RPKVSSRPACPSTGGALGYRASLASAAAAWTPPRPGDGQGLLGPIDRLAQRELNSSGEILAPGRSARRDALLCRKAKSSRGLAAGPTEQIFKEIPVVRAAGTRKGPPVAAATSGRRSLVGAQGFGLLLVEADLRGVFAKLVVQPALLGVREDLERARE